MSGLVAMLLALAAGLGVAAWRWFLGEPPEEALRLGALALGLACLAVGVARRFAPPSAPSPWASRKEIAEAGLLEGEGVVLARLGRRYLTLNRPAHALVLGGTRSGKTSGVLIPSLLNWTGSALVFDPKGELWEATSGCAPPSGRACASTRRRRARCASTRFPRSSRATSRRRSA